MPGKNHNTYNYEEALPEPMSNREVLQALYRRVRAAQVNIDLKPIEEFNMSFLSGQEPPAEQFIAAIEAAEGKGAYEALRDAYLEVNG